jgi:hypothetical protein
MVGIDRVAQAGKLFAAGILHDPPGAGETPLAYDFKRAAFLEYDMPE